jgi:hypothetical protein
VIFPVAQKQISNQMKTGILLNKAVKLFIVDIIHHSHPDIQHHTSAKTHLPGDA